MFKKLFSPLVDGISAALAMSGLFGLLHMCGLLDDRVSAAWATGSLGASMVLFISCPESKLTTPRGDFGKRWLGLDRDGLRLVFRWLAQARGDRRCHARVRLYGIG